MSTRANLKLVSSNKNEKSYYLRKWHDGYGVGEFLKTILTGFKEDGEEIKIESLAEVLQSGLNSKEDSDFDYELWEARKVELKSLKLALKPFSRIGVGLASCLATATRS